MKLFIKGRNFYTIDNPKKIRKAKAIKSIARIKRRITRKITNSVIRTRRAKRRRNISCKSYFRRYILPKNKRLFRRTLGINLNLKRYYQEESEVFFKLRKDIKRHEHKLMLKEKWGRRSIYRPLSKRAFSLGRVYLTHRRRNTFITIHHLALHRERLRQRVVFKVTGGLIGYTGPKRSTKHAREAVAKEAGAFLAARQFTSIDVIMTSGVGRIYSFLIRLLFRTPIYVRHFIISKRRSHGFTRLRKARRT